MAEIIYYLRSITLFPHPHEGLNYRVKNIRLATVGVSHPVERAVAIRARRRYSHVRRAEANSIMCTQCGPQIAVLEANGRRRGRVEEDNGCGIKSPTRTPHHYHGTGIYIYYAKRDFMFYYYIQGDSVFIKSLDPR